MAGPVTEAAASASDLVVRRQGHVILDSLTFTIPRGRVTGLLGPSGCGKTTLMRTLVGVQVIDAGRVELLGLPAGDPRLRPRVGYATQEPAVYGDLTLAENLQYFGTVLGLPRSRLAAAIAQTVATLDLTGLERRLVGTFSGGQLARADLAVALLAEPDLLVLDEPTVGLDPVLRRDLWAMFHRLAAGGTTLLVSSHVMDEAARCDHLLFMREGRFLAAASPADMLAATGAADLESAFLALAGQRRSGLVGPGDQGRRRHPRVHRRCPRGRGPDPAPPHPLDRPAGDQGRPRRGPTALDGPASPECGGIGDLSRGS